MEHSLDRNLILARADTLKIFTIKKSAMIQKDDFTLNDRISDMAAISLDP